jgi:hypothetical protein
MDSWWGELERDVLACLHGGEPTSVETIAHRLALSEAAVTSLLAMLARDGKVRIRFVEPTSGVGCRPRAA